MKEHEQQPKDRECRHFLWLVLRPGKQEFTLWARCKFCRRSWFLGSEAEIIAGVSRFESEAS